MLHCVIKLVADRLFAGLRCAVDVIRNSYSKVNSERDFRDFETFGHNTLNNALDDSNFIVHVV